MALQRQRVLREYGHSLVRSDRELRLIDTNAFSDSRIRLHMHARYLGSNADALSGLGVELGDAHQASDDWSRPIGMLGDLLLQFAPSGRSSSMSRPIVTEEP